MSLKGKLLTPERLAGRILGRKTMQDDDDVGGGIPSNAIVTEAGDAIVTEAGDIVVVE